MDIDQRQILINEAKAKIEQNQKYLLYTDPNTFLGRLGVKREIKYWKKQLEKLEKEDTE